MTEIKNNENTIGLVVDEVADLPQELISKYQIEVVPYNADWPEGKDLPGENIFQKMREAEKRGIKTLVNTSQPSPKAFLDRYRSQLQKFEKVLSIVISSRLSGGYNSALLAKEFLKPEEKEKVFVVDSLNGSAGEGLLALKAIDLIQEGQKKIEKIIEEIKKIIPQIHLFGMLEDPKWLEYSGRLPHFLADWIKRAQKSGVRPLVGVKKGKVGAVGIRVRAKDTATALFQELELRTKKLREKGEKIRVAITHADNLEEAQKLKAMIKEKLENVEISFLNLMDIVIGARVGPGTLVCGWCKDSFD